MTKSLDARSDATVALESAKSSARTSDQESSGNDGRVAAIDVLRGFAIAAVVMRHVSWQVLTPANVAAPGGMAIAAACMASDIGVSLFIALSAFGLSWRYAEPFAGARAWLAFLGSRAMRLLPAYLIWSLASLAARDPSLLLSPATVADALLRGTADVQFYYVPLVFELYILWPLLRPFGAARSAAGAAAVVLAAWIVAGFAWRTAFPWPWPWTPVAYFLPAIATGCVLPLIVGGPRPATTRNPFVRPQPRGIVPLAFLAALAGAAIVWCVWRFATLAPSVESRGGLFLLTMVSAGPQAVFNVSAIVVLSLLAAPIARTRAGGWLAALGRTSYGVFLVHLLIASTLVYRVFAITEPAPGVLARMLGAWLTILVLSHTLVTWIARIPAIAWTVGAPPRESGVAAPP